MILRRGILCVLAVSGAARSAQAAEPAPLPPDAYRAVMEAQYAARTPAPPMRPDEAQRIYETYLNTIGRPARDPDTGGNRVMPSR